MTTEAPYIPGLTRTEALIYDTLRQADGALVTHSALSLAVWGYEVKTPSIAVYVKRVRGKLGRNAITSVTGYGYRLGAAPEPCEHCGGTGYRRAL